MADEVVIPVTFDTTGAEEKIAHMQGKLAQAAGRAMGMPDPQWLKFAPMEAKLNAMAPVDVAELRGKNPQFDRALKQYNQFATTGKSGDEQKQQAQLLRQMNQQRRQELQLAQQQYQANMRLLSTITNIAMGGASGAVRAAALSAGARMLAGGGVSATGARLAGAAGAAAGAGGGLSPAAIASTVGALVSSGALGTIASIAGPAAVLAGAGILVNNATTGETTAAQNLFANTGAPGDQTYLQTTRTSRQYEQGQGDVENIYKALGRSGMQSSQIAANAGNTLAFSRETGLDLGTSTQLTAALGTQGRLNSDQIGTFFDSVVKGSSHLGMSMTQLTDVFTAFQKATNDTSLSVSGLQSVMATRAALGNQLSSQQAVSAIAPLTNATGTQAMKLATVLGISQDQLRAEQQGGNGGTAQLFQQYGSFLRKQIGNLNPNSAQAQNIAEAINQQVGGFDFTGLGASQQFRLVGLAMSNPNAALSEYNKMQAQMQPTPKGFIGPPIPGNGPPSAADLTGQGHALALGETSLAQQAAIAASAIEHQTLPSIKDDIHALATGASQFNILDPSTWGNLVTAPFLQSMNNMGWGDIWNAITGGGSAGAGGATGGTYINSGRGGAWQPGGTAPGTASTPDTGATATGSLDAARVKNAKAIAAGTGVPWQIAYAWAQEEGANPANNNPLNIENVGQKGASTAFTSSDGTKIAKFDTLSDAIASYQRTLTGGGYAGVESALKGGDPTAILKALEQSGWAPGGQYGNALEQLYGKDFTAGGQGGSGTPIQVTVTVQDQTTQGVKATVSASQQNVPHRTPKGARTPVKIPQIRLPNMLSGW